MPIIKIRTTTRNGMAQKVVDDIDAGSGAGKLKFYSGSMPANADTAVTSQTLLGTLVCSDPSANVATGTVTFAAITQDNAADNGGTASFVAVTDSNDVVVCYLDVTDTGGTGAVKLNTVTIVAGGPILMNSLTITVGGA